MAHDVVLGKILEGAHERDAIHVAIAPVVAAEALMPGQHVGFVDDDDDRLVGSKGEWVGIVDPYLRTLVEPGQQFFICLYPQTVTSLRHDWSHPAFKSRAAIRSEEWLREFADDVELSYEALMQKAGESFSRSDFDMHFGTTSAQDYRPRDFWNHYESVAGVSIPGHSKENAYFSCSC